MAVIDNDTTTIEDAIPPAQPKPSGEARVRLHFLDGLRGLAALYVCLYHVWLTAFAFPGGGHMPRWMEITQLLKWGHYAVGIFIVLSGFVLMLPVVKAGGVIRDGFGGFVKRRARRLLPPYYAIFAISLLLTFLYPPINERIGGGGGADHSSSMTTIVATHILLVHNLYSKWELFADEPLWSVATEWQIYFFFPLLLIPLWKRFGLVAPIVVGYAIGLATLIPHWDAACLWYLGLFAMGMSAAAVCAAKNVPDRIRQLPWASIAVSAAVIAVALLLGLHGFNHMPVLDPIVGIAASALIISVYLDHEKNPDNPASVASKILSYPPVVGLGIFSYSVYLVHQPILNLESRLLLALGLHAARAFLVLFFLGVPLILVIAYLFHLAVERPFMNLPPPERKRGAANA